MGTIDGILCAGMAYVFKLVLDIKDKMATKKDLEALKKSLEHEMELKLAVIEQKLSNTRQPPYHYSSTSFSEDERN